MRMTPASVSASSPSALSALAFCNLSVTSVSALRRTRPSLCPSNGVSARKNGPDESKPSKALRRLCPLASALFADLDDGDFPGVSSFTPTD